MRVALAPSASERTYRYFPRLRLPLLAGSFFVVGAVVFAVMGKTGMMYASLGFVVIPFAILLLGFAGRRVVEVTPKHLVIPRLFRSDQIVGFDRIRSVDDGDERLDIEDWEGRTFIIIGDWLPSSQDFADLAALIKERVERANKSHGAEA